jgi:hypothetical protein
MNEEQQHIVKFLRYYYIDQIQGLQAAGFSYISFVLIAQSIELLGTLLDDKPFRAQNQARKRFNLALVKLFPSKYAKTNLESELYEHYRCNMSHRFLPSKYIRFETNIPDEQHLSVDKEGVITLGAEQLAVDLRYAVNKMIVRIESGTTLPKKTGLDFTQFINVNA